MTVRTTSTHRRARCSITNFSVFTTALLLTSTFTEDLPGYLPHAERVAQATAMTKSLLSRSSVIKQDIFPSRQPVRHHRCSTTTGQVLIRKNRCLARLLINEPGVNWGRILEKPPLISGFPEKRDRRQGLQQGQHGLFDFSNDSGRVF